MASTNTSLINGLDREAHTSATLNAEDGAARVVRRGDGSTLRTSRARRRRRAPVTGADDEAVERRQSSLVHPDVHGAAPVRITIDAASGRLGVVVELLNTTSTAHYVAAREPLAGTASSESSPRARSRSNEIEVVEDKAGWAPIETLAEVLDDENADDEWLWPGHIPAGAITGLEGMPGEGKSSITMDLAARITRGEPMPFCDGRRSPAGVVVFNSEDAKQVIRRRAVAAGADLGRMAILGAESVGIFGDLGRLQAAVDKVAARLVIVDPVMAAFGRGTNSKDDQSVRRELSPLAELAARTGAAIVVVRHPTKSASGDLRYQGSGTIGITAALRSILAVREHVEHPGERLLVHVKCNCGPLAKPISYKIVPAGRAGRVDWLGQVEPESP